MPRPEFEMPREISKEMANAAYRVYCEESKKGYIAWADICACFRAAFNKVETE